MALFAKVADFLAGGMGSKIVDTVKDYFPPSMSDQEKAQVNQAILQSAREHEVRLLTLAQEGQEEFNERIKDLEGTAADLQQAGWFGKVIIFLRGAQRPVWGFGVLILDFQVFSGAWQLRPLDVGGGQVVDLVSTFWAINLLVLGFLFGERAAKNILPLLQQKLSRGAAG